MKLKHKYVYSESFGINIAATPTHNAIIQNNEVGNLIMHLLESETTEEHIVDEICGKYEVERAVAAADVKAIIEKLRAHGLLEE